MDKSKRGADVDVDKINVRTSKRVRIETAKVIEARSLAQERQQSKPNRGLTPLDTVGSEEEEEDTSQPTQAVSEATSPEPSGGSESSEEDSDNSNGLEVRIF